MFLLDTNGFKTSAFRPVPYLTVSKKEFIKEWEQCYYDLSRDRTKLVGYLSRNIDHWIDMLLNPASRKTIEYFSLVVKVGSEENVELEDRISTVRLWADTHQETLYTELIMIWLRLLRGKRRKKWDGEAKQHVFVLSRRFILRLSSAITIWYRKYLREQQYISAPRLEISMDKEPEELQNLRIEISRLPRWDLYMVQLFLSEMDRYAMAELTGTTRTFIDMWRSVNENFKD